MNFVKENRLHSNEYLIRTTQSLSNRNFDLEALLKQQDFWELIQRKEKLKDDECLGLLFNFNNINIDDFKEFSQNELIEYIEKELLDTLNLEISVYEIKDKKINFHNLDDFIEYCKNNIEPIKPEINEITKLFLNFKNTLTQADKYYLLNKDWFKFDSNKVFEIEYLSYSIYIFIIWIIKNNIFTCELSWD